MVNLFIACFMIYEPRTFQILNKRTNITCLSSKVKFNVYANVSEVLLLSLLR